MKNKKTYSIFFWLAISLIVILNLLLWLYLNQVEEKFAANLKTRLLIENRSISRIINDDYLSAIIPGETNSLEYISLLQTLDDIRSQDSLQSIIIFTPEGEILISSPELIGVQKESIHTDRAYFIAATNGAYSTTNIQKIANEKFMSAYGPVTDIYNRSLGVLVIEVKATYFITIDNLRHQLILFSIINLSVIAIIALFLFRMINRAIQFQATIKDQEHLAQLGTMGASVAHEIRNPLGIIEGTNELIRKKYGTNNDEIFDYIPNEINRLSEIIENFLAFARTPKVNIKSFKLAHLVSRLKLAISYEKKADIRFNIEDDKLEILSDENLLEQALLNILINAVEAVGSDGEINVSVLSLKNEIQIKIQNSGPIIKQETLSQIFQPFFTTKEKGTGLGLAISKRIIELLKGEIMGESNGTAGTTFTILLPKKK